MKHITQITYTYFGRFYSNLQVIFIYQQPKIGRYIVPNETESQPRSQALRSDARNERQSEEPGNEVD